MCRASCVDFFCTLVSLLSELKITTILGDRLDPSSIKAGKTTPGSDGKEERVVRTLGRREISAELIVRILTFLRISIMYSCYFKLLCTGQKSITDLVARAISDAVILDGSKKDSYVSSEQCRSLSQVIPLRPTCQ